jgi:hypothetical protein
MSFSKFLLSLVFAAAAGGAIASPVITQSSGSESDIRCTFVMTPTPEITDVAAATADVSDAMGQSIFAQFPNSSSIIIATSPVVFNGNGADTVSANFTISGETDDAVTAFVTSWQGEVLSGTEAQWAVNFTTGCGDLQPPASINCTFLMTPTPEIDNANTALDDISAAMSGRIDTEFPNSVWETINFPPTLNSNGTDTASAQFIVFGETDDDLTAFITSWQGEILDGDEAQWTVNSVVSCED